MQRVAHVHSPILRSGAGSRQLTCPFNHLVGAEGRVGTAEEFFTPSSFALARAAITLAALHHPDRPATRGLAAFHRLVWRLG
jgi:hypothetical protein